MCPFSAAWCRRVLPKASVTFGVRGRWSKFSSICGSFCRHASIILLSSSASGNSNSNTTSWTFTTGANSSSSRISLDPDSNKNLCRNLGMPVWAATTCLISLAAFPVQSSTTARVSPENAEYTVHIAVAGNQDLAISTDNDWHFWQCQMRLSPQSQQTATNSNHTSPDRFLFQLHSPLAFHETASCRLIIQLSMMFIGSRVWYE